MKRSLTHLPPGPPRVFPSAAPEPGEPPPAFYLDGHKKPVYTDHLIPRGLIGRTGKILGCRALLLLHDAKGHPLFATTQRGDLHLTKGVPDFLARYEQATNRKAIARLIVDREGMAAEFLHMLAEEGRTVVTILHPKQYKGLDSFTDVGTFVPLCRDRAGRVTREVAPARFALALPDHPGETLTLTVALIRDLRCRMPVAHRPSEDDTAPSWYDDLVPGHWCWWEAGWVATPAPAVPTEPKLIPIVTTAADVDPVELVQTYTRRWPAQENSLRDFLVSVGLDTNHGYAKHPVENSESAKVRADLERKLACAGQLAEKARERCQQAEQRSRQYDKQAKAARAELAQAAALREQIRTQPAQPTQHLLSRVWTRQERAEARLATAKQRQQRVDDTFRAEIDTCERHCQRQRALLRQLTDLAESERAMYELDHAKDQVMTVLKLALANLGLWARDHYFPATYAHATWHRLEPFFRLPGHIVSGTDTVCLELDGFNDRQLTRDLAIVCARVNAAHPRLQGQRIQMHVRNLPCASGAHQRRLA